MCLLPDTSNGTGTAAYLVARAHCRLPTPGSQRLMINYFQKGVAYEGGHLRAIRELHGTYAAVPIGTWYVARNLIMVLLGTLPVQNTTACQTNPGNKHISKVPAYR